MFFEHTKQFFLVQCFAYIFGFVAPFIYAEFGDEYLEEALAICSITMGGFTLIEILDMKENKKDYFKSAWNYFDLTFIIAWYTFFTLKWCQNFDRYVITDMKDEYTNEIILMNMLKVFVICFSFLKIISFCRVFEGFASLIMLLTTVMGDLLYFQTFFFALITFFTVIQQVLSM